MRECWKVDEYIVPTGPRGNGTYRAYDRKSGREGYVDESTNYFYPDSPKENKQSSNMDDSTSTAYNNSYTNYINYSNTPGRGFMDILTEAIKAIGIVILGVGASSYLSARNNNPDDQDDAIKKAVRNGSCAAGIIGVIIIMVISALIWFIYHIFVQSEGHLFDIIIGIIEVICLCTLIGLIRIIMGRRFVPRINGSDVKDSLKNIRSELRITRTTSLVIIIASVILLFKSTFTLLMALAILILGGENIVSMPETSILIFQLVVALLTVATDIVAGFFISRLLSAIFSKFSKNS